VSRWPTFVTGLGFGFGVGALYLLASGHAGAAVAALLLLSLVCDVLDGRLARELGATSAVGAELDWHVDCALAAVAAWTVLGVAPLALVVAVQATARATGRKVSGRALVFVACAFLQFAAP
jgi:CDP-diacylglycerol---serine O-phosphatidyltransferase